MKEILFRGKIPNVIDWVYGYYAKRGENHFILLDTESEDNFSIVNEETVGLFIGLTDKNGTKIFEGDLVKDNYGMIMQIVYNNRRHRFTFCLVKSEKEWANNFIHTEFDDWFEVWFKDGKNEVEVIGNIYDNPTLNCWRWMNERR